MNFLSISRLVPWGFVRLFGKWLKRCRKCDFSKTVPTGRILYVKINPLKQGVIKILSLVSYIEYFLNDISSCPLLAVMQNQEYPCENLPISFELKVDSSPYFLLEVQESPLLFKTLVIISKSIHIASFNP